MSSNISTTDQLPILSLEQLLNDLNQLNSSGEPVYEPYVPESVQPPPIHQQVKKRTIKKDIIAPSIVLNNINHSQDQGWTQKPTNDAPVITWVDQDEGYQYTVQNASNRGECLVKIQLYEGGALKHMSGIYMDRQTDMHNTLTGLLTQMENLWVDRGTGTPKTDGLIRTKMPLAKWRTLNAPSPDVKRKRVTAAPRRNRSKTSAPTPYTRR